MGRGVTYTIHHLYMNMVCVYSKEVQTRLNIQVEILALGHGVTIVYTSGDAFKNMYTEAYYTWNIYVISGHYRRIVTYIYIKMAIEVYMEEEGRACI